MRIVPGIRARSSVRARTSFIAILAASVVYAASLANVASADGSIAVNKTDLPTYPHLISATMSGGGPGAGGFFDAKTNDPFNVVAAWYRSHLHGAKESKSGFIMKQNVQFNLTYRNEQVVLVSNSPGTGIALGEDAR
jgi:hypothetical protein